MKHLLLTFLLFSFFQLAAQTTSDVKDIQVAKKQLRVGTDTSRYVSTTAHTITPASTHRQMPTAKAVYDYLSGQGGGSWQFKTATFTPGNTYFTIAGYTLTDYARIRVMRNGLEYRVGDWGCGAACGVAFDDNTGRYYFWRALAVGERIDIIVKM